MDALKPITVTPNVAEYLVQIALRKGLIVYVEGHGAEEYVRKAAHPNIRVAPWMGTTYTVEKVTIEPMKIPEGLLEYEEFVFGKKREK